MENSDTALRRYLDGWWLFTLAGMQLIGCGAWVGLSTNADFAGLTALFVFAYLGNGTSEIAFATINRRVVPSWGGILVLGIFESVLGLLLMVSPPTHVHVLIGYVALWLLSRGMLLFLVAVDMEAVGPSRSWVAYAIGGLAATGSGLLVFIQSNVTIGSLVVWTALGMIVTGAFFIFYSLQVRKASFRIEEVRQKLRNVDRVPH